jgi:hypothetical protein
MWQAGQVGGYPVREREDEEQRDRDHLRASDEYAGLGRGGAGGGDRNRLEAREGRAAHTLPSW